MTRAIERSSTLDQRVERTITYARAVLGSAGPTAATGVVEGAVVQLGRGQRERRLLLEAEIAALGVYAAQASRQLWRRLDRYTGLAGRTPAERKVLAMLAVRYQYQGTRPAADVLELARRAHSGGRLAEEGAPESLHWGYTMSAFASVDAVDEVEAVVEAAGQKARARGWSDGFAYAACGMCLAKVRQGRLHEAEDEGTAALALVSGLEPTASRVVVATLARLGVTESLLERGRLDEAATMPGENEPQAVGDDAGSITEGYVRALLHLARCRPAAVVGVVERLRTVELASGWVQPATPWRALGALAYAQLGQLDRSHCLAEEQLDIAKRWDNPRELGIALRVLASLDRGGRRIEMLEGSLASLHRSPARLERAKSLVELGVALRVAGKRAAAKEQLMAGSDAASVCGAAGLVERARAELRLLGARPRRRTFSGVDALTPCEQRIAAMAVDGQSNSQIAQALFVTQKAVEFHLANVFRKLAVSSRDQLTPIFHSHSGQATQS